MPENGWKLPSAAIEPLFKPSSRPDPQAGQAARAAQRAAWPPVRQPHPGDRDYLKAILKAHDVRRIPEAEPPTLKRLQRLLRRAGITQKKAKEAAGHRLPALIERNAGMALWWLVATILEAGMSCSQLREIFESLENGGGRKGTNEAKAAKESTHDPVAA